MKDFSFKDTIVVEVKEKDAPPSSSIKTGVTKKIPYATINRYSKYRCICCGAPIIRNGLLSGVFHILLCPRCGAKNEFK